VGLPSCKFVEKAGEWAGRRGRRPLQNNVSVLLTGYGSISSI